jgi:RNA polymerase sigma factor (sigma-70 family)
VQNPPALVTEHLDLTRQAAFWVLKRTSPTTIARVGGVEEFFSVARCTLVEAANSWRPGQGVFRAYAFGAIRCALLRLIERHPSRRELAAEDIDALAVARERDPEQSALYSERREIASLAVGGLKPAALLALEVYYFDPLTPVEAAARLGKSAEATRHARWRALESLRRAARDADLPGATTGRGGAAGPVRARGGSPAVGAPRVGGAAE